MVKGRVGEWVYGMRDWGIGYDMREGLGMEIWHEGSGNRM